MKIPNDNWLKAVLNFSEPSIITSTTIDLEDWWKSTVHQLNDWEINLLYIALKSAINEGLLNGDITSMMFSELEGKVLKPKNDVNYSLTLSNTLLG